jgi:hypothetical protein
MTDQAREGLHVTADGDDDLAPIVADERVSTGVASVDRVLGELDGLDDLPLDQHVAAFEGAHDSLRSALDAPADPQPDDLA